MKEIECLMSRYKKDALVTVYNIENNEITYTCDQIDSELKVSLVSPSHEHLNHQDEIPIEVTIINNETEEKTVDKKVGRIIDVLSSILSKQLEKFNEQIEYFNALESPTPTPMTDIQPDFEFDYDSPTENEFTKDIDEAVALFGLSDVKALKDLYNIRFRIATNYLPSSITKIYQTTEQPIYLSVTFGPSYTKQEKKPKVEYSPSTQKQPLGIQCHLILNDFLKYKWSKRENMNQALLDHPRLKHFKQISKNDVAKECQRLISKKKDPLAIVCLVYLLSNENIEKTKEFLREKNVGIGLPQLEFRQAKNFIVEMIVFLHIALIRANTHCICCGTPVLDFKHIENDMGFVCTKQMCQYQCVEKIVCPDIPCSIQPISIYDDVRQNSDIADLLISMTYSAAGSTRSNIVFVPKPKQTPSEVRTIISQFPSVEEMLKCGSDEKLHKKMGKDGYELLDWILRTKRPLMVVIPKENRIKKLNTTYQYLLQLDSYDKHHNFQKMKKKYGSYYAFHGSSIENFHSILRNGLFVASGTKFQTTGAAYGKGIYMAKEISTSFGYAKVGTTWTRSGIMNDSNSTIRCVIICEVVKHSCVPLIPKPYYVIPDAKYVTTRFFLFFKGNLSSNVTIDDITTDIHRFYKE